MKLIKRVQELEESQRVERAQTAGVGLAWTTHEELADENIDPDEIATDIHIVDTKSDGLEEWRTVERRRRDAEDLGDVFDEAGVRIGRVTGRDGSFGAVGGGGGGGLTELYFCSALTRHLKD